MRHTFDALNNHKIFEYESYEEFVSYVGALKGKSQVACMDSESSDSSFTGSKSWDEAMHLAKFGWDEGTKKIKDIMDDVKVLGTSTTFNPSFDVVGDSVDIGRYLTGEPENMVTWEEVEKEGMQVVNVYFNIAANWCVTAAQKMHYGAAILSAVDKMESSGTRVNLYVYSQNCRKKKYANNFDYCTVCIPIKKASDSLNLSIAAFAMVHPSMSRRLLFKWLEQHPDLWNEGYRAPACIFPIGDGITFKSYTSEGNWTYIDRKKRKSYKMVGTSNLDFMTNEDTKKWLADRLPAILEAHNSKKF